jgi:hypothetical protein
MVVRMRLAHALMVATPVLLAGCGNNSASAGAELDAGTSDAGARSDAQGDGGGTGDASRAETGTPPCSVPDYPRGYTGTDPKDYVGVRNVPPPLNSSFTDPAFNNRLWRLSDATTDPTGPQASVGVAWATGVFAGVWNQNQTALALTASDGYTLLMKIDLSNPSAPVVNKWPCSWPSPMPFVDCNAGQVVLGQYPAWSNTQNYVMSWYGPDNRIYSLDFAASYLDPATPPTATLLADPFAPGECMSGDTRGFPEGVNLSSDDRYATGVTRMGGDEFAIVKLDAAPGQKCKKVDMSTAQWTLSGATAWGCGSPPCATGPFSFVDNGGGSIASPGANTVHGGRYDQYDDTFELSSSIGDFRIYVDTLQVADARSIFSQMGYSGPEHGVGLFDEGSARYEINMGYVSNSQLCAWSQSLRVPMTNTSWGCFPPAPVNLDGHGSGVWCTGFPNISAWYSYGDNDPTPGPPITSYDVAQAYQDEIVIWKFADSSGTSDVKYRFVHTYSPAGGYDSGGSNAYQADVGPALSPDRCWVVFPSNWLGNLGTDRDRATPCSSTTRCAYDTFLVHLCGPN